MPAAKWRPMSQLTIDPWGGVGVLAWAPRIRTIFAAVLRGSCTSGSQATARLGVSQGAGLCSARR